MGIKSRLCSCLENLEIRRLKLRVAELEQKQEELELTNITLKRKFLEGVTMVETTSLREPIRYYDERDERIQIEREETY